MLTIVAAPADRPTSDLLHARSVAVVGGDVYFVEASGGAARRLTSRGLDTEATLSPDGQTIAFVWRTPGLMVNTVTGPDDATELWVMRVDGTGARVTTRARQHEVLRKSGALDSHAFPVYTYLYSDRK